MTKTKVTTNQLADMLYELMDFLKENMVVRADLERYATKEDLYRVEEKIDAVSGQVGNLKHRFSVLEDQQVKLQQTVEIELLAPTLRMDRMEGRLGIVETKLGLAS